MKSIVFVSPYVPKHTGGGERYLFDAARLAAEHHQVFMAIPADQLDLYASAQKKQLQTIKKKYEDFLGQSLERVAFIPSPLTTAAGFFQKLNWTKQFDVVYYATDGSVFLSRANKNILHIQIPFTDQKSWFERLKLATWQVKNTNSFFTKKVVEKHWGITVDYVHWPMTELRPIKDLSKQLAQKEPIILHVGRFFRQLHTKRQDVLIQAFQKLLSRHPDVTKNWKLVLIGSVEDESYAQEIAELAKGLPVEIHHQVDRAELWQWYDRASFYWHATGFGVDPTIHPEKVEHFGITTMEAMSRGCLPIVINKGGQPEILGDSLQNLLWDTIDQCADITAHYIEHPDDRKAWAETAFERVQQFGPAQFQKTLLEMIRS